MINDELDLIAKIGQLANGFQRETVVSASANIILNALRQEHPTLVAAQNQFEAMVVEMRAALADKHYDAAGNRQDRKIVLPSRLFDRVPG